MVALGVWECSDFTVTILREIRDEVRGTRTDLTSRIDETNQRLGGIEERLGGVEGRLGGVEERLGGVEGRLGIVEDTLKDFAGQQLILTRYVKDVVDRHDTQFDDLGDRVTSSRRSSIRRR